MGATLATLGTRSGPRAPRPGLRVSPEIEQQIVNWLAATYRVGVARDPSGRNRHFFRWGRGRIGTASDFARAAGVDPARIVRACRRADRRFAA